jgi:hypothetical protein
LTFAQMESLLRRAGVSVCLGAALWEHVHGLYLAFAKDVYALCAASNNLQSLFSLYTLCRDKGVPMEAVHDHLRTVVRALYQPTLTSLKEVISRDAERVRAPATWVWYPLPFFARYQEVVTKLAAELASTQARKGSMRQSTLCRR